MPRYINEDDFCEYIRKSTTPSGAEWTVSKIKDMPSADVAEVKHGKWINDKGLYKCSVCNELWSHWWAIVVGDERMNKMMKFCPNCGADMRGETDA